MIKILSILNPEIKKMEKADYISLYRNHLMGIAILWIVLYHSNVDFGEFGLLSSFCNYIKSMGYLGVDIFFFVSGFGLMNSWYKKKISTISFYKRRFSRIMPLYWLFLSINLVLLALVGTPITDLSTVLIYYTGLSFFAMSTQFHWFISAILLCYLIFPFFAKNFQKSEDKLKFVIFVIILCLTLSIVLTASSFVFAKKFSFLLILMLRLPAFFIGSFVGYICVKKDNNFNFLFSIYFHLIIVFYCTIALGLVYYCYLIKVLKNGDMGLYGLYWYPFVLGSFSLTFLLSIVLDILHTHFDRLLKFLDKMGRSSLELYFIHLLIFAFIGSELIYSYFGILLKNNYLWSVNIFMSVILAIIFNSIEGLSSKIFIGLTRLRNKIK